MTTDNSSRHSDASRPLGRRSDGELRFSPYFSVYVLPPDGVCLYAENRKVFLRGELYCALAPRLAAGERPEAIVSALSLEFPAAKIDEAIKRLLDRGFLVPAMPIDDVAAGYWASLGLSAETAAENLANTSVQVEAIGAAGRSELAAALREFGVRVVDHAANLTVVLVEDYLDGRLAEFNRRQLTQQREWLLAQPSGLFPLVGPIFGPRKSACWRCLAERMKLNRLIKAFLDREDAHCVAASPLNKNLPAPGAIGLAATEIAKAVASGFRTDLRDTVISLDLLGSAVARHHVPSQPQCASCGDNQLRDPMRPPAPIRLRAGGKAALATSGYRSAAPAETLARFRKHVSQLTGVVSQLERIESEQALDFTFLARHSFSPRPDVVDAPRVRLIGDSYGKGSTAEQGEASALMKAVERYCGIFQGDEIRKTGTFVDFPAGDAIVPNDILLFSDAQHGRGSHGESHVALAGPPAFDPTAEIEWSPVWSLRDERFKYLPTGLLYFFHDAAGGRQFNPDSSGCAAGNALEEAVLQGFLELVERDAHAIWWYNRLQCPEIDLDRLGDSYIRDLRVQFAAMGRRFWVLDVTSDLGIPVAVAVAHWHDGVRECLALAAGAHFDLRNATLQAATELNRCLAVEAMKRRSGGSTAEDQGGALPLPLRKNGYLLPHGKAVARRAHAAKFASLDRREQVLACVKLAKRLGLDFLVLDQTRPDIQVPVVRVIVPGLRHVDRRFAPGRLYDVPVRLGLRKRSLREAEFNPLPPRSG
jgi:oxazoline/thiazoline synthase